MLHSRSLRASTLILALALAACSGSNPPADSSAATATSAVEATAPAASSTPVSEPSQTSVATAAVAQADSDVQAGEQTYQKTCAMCHGSPAMGAPVLGNKDDWKDRIAQGNDTLYKHAMEGFTGAKGMMPARGGNPSLDDASIKAAVDFMAAKSQ